MSATPLTAHEKSQAIVCLKDDGSPIAAFTSIDVTRFIAARAKELDGMIALNEHKVSDVLGEFDLTGRWAAMDETTSLGMAIKELQKPRIQVLVGVDGKTGKATGAIIRAHRGY